MGNYLGRYSELDRWGEVWFVPRGWLFAVHWSKQRPKPLAATTSVFSLHGEGIVGWVCWLKAVTHLCSRIHFKIHIASFPANNDYRLGWEVHSGPHEQICLQGNGIWSAQGRLEDLSCTWVQGEEKALSSKRRLTVQHLGSHWPWNQVRLTLWPSWKNSNICHTLSTPPAFSLHTSICHNPP